MKRIVGLGQVHLLARSATDVETKPKPNKASRMCIAAMLIIGILMILMLQCIFYAHQHIQACHKIYVKAIYELYNYRTHIGKM